MFLYKKERKVYAQVPASTGRETPKSQDLRLSRTAQWLGGIIIIYSYYKTPYYQEKKVLITKKKKKRKVLIGTRQHVGAG